MQYNVLERVLVRKKENTSPSGADSVWQIITNIMSSLYLIVKLSWKGGGGQDMVSIKSSSNNTTNLQ
jgi:hypothetical protein